jgi:hypothetical protein
LWSKRGINEENRATERKRDAEIHPTTENALQTTGCLENTTLSQNSISKAMKNGSRSFSKDKSMEVMIYKNKKQIALFRKQGKLWFKFMPETPKGYADAMAKVLKKNPDYSPCWYGRGERPPEEDGYIFLYKVKMTDVTSDFS